jgi:hypothetical protein
VVLQTSGEAGDIAGEHRDQLEHCRSTGRRGPRRGGVRGDDGARRGDENPGARRCRRNAGRRVGSAEASKARAIGLAEAKAAEALGLARAEGFEAQRQALGATATALVAAINAIAQGGVDVMPDILVTGGGSTLDGLAATPTRMLSANGTTAGY